jgi:polyhydroxybutyrate depolymerase
MSRTAIMAAFAAGVVATALPKIASAIHVDGSDRYETSLASASASPAKGSLSTAQHRVLDFAGGTRDYLIQPVPGNERHPVVILLHGGNSDNATVWTETSLPTLGSRIGFIVVAPNASMNKHWNDGRGTTGEGKPSTADDVGYLKALIGELVTRERGDPDSIFMVGVSNGGVMTMRFACEAGRLLRAGSNVVSNMPTRQLAACKIGKPLPWLSINGDHDTRMNFKGYPTGTLVLGHPQAGLESADETFKFFADNAGCSAAERIQGVPDIDQTDHSTAVKRVRLGCAGGATSTQYVLYNAGHGWPGFAYSPQSTRSRGGVNEDIDAGSVIWAHFRQTLPRRSQIHPQ